MEYQLGSPTSSSNEYDDPIFEELIRNSTIEIAMTERSYMIDNSIDEYDDPIFEELIKRSTTEIAMTERSYSVDDMDEIPARTSLDTPLSQGYSDDGINENPTAASLETPLPQDICMSHYATIMNGWMQQGNFLMQTYMVLL